MRIFILIMTFFMIISNANALDATDIVKKTLHAFYYQGDDMRAKVDMRIIDSQGRERKRSLTVLRKNIERDGKQKYFVFFHKPADVNKMVFMAWKNILISDDRWLYLPALDLVKRIAASDERTSFIGSHFFYEDISGRFLNEDTHNLVKETDTQYIIKNVPKNPDDVEFSYYKMWIDKTTFLPMRLEYFNENNTVYRTYTTLEVNEINGYPTIISSEMKDNRTAGKTLLTYSNIKYSLGIPEKIFTERYLRKAPKKYLR